jgi:hypothetical protein
LKHFKYQYIHAGGGITQSSATGPISVIISLW